VSWFSGIYSAEKSWNLLVSFECECWRCVLWCRPAVPVLMWVELSSRPLHVHEQLPRCGAARSLNASRLPQSLPHWQVAGIQSCLSSRRKCELTFVYVSWTDFWPHVYLEVTHSLVLLHRVFFFICALSFAFSVLILLVRQQKEHPTCKKLRCWRGYLSGARCRYLHMV